jgi:hypothetical protein
MQIFCIKDIPWHKSSLKKHGEKHEEGEKVPEFKRFSGNRISIQHSKQYTKEGTNNTYKNCDCIRPKQFHRIIEQKPVCVHTGFAWKKGVSIVYK